MITLPDPMPFSDALNYLRDKQAAGSSMDTAAWREVPAAIRNKAFFSATLTSAQVARRMQDYIDDFLSQDRDVNERGQEFFSSQGRSEFVSKFRQMMMDEGFGKVLPDGSIAPDINDNDLRDLRSCRRLQLIFDTQVEQAYSYGQFLEGQDEDILDIWPCWKFVRVRPVMSPRPYHDAALGQIRRKDDLDFWLSLNRDFNVPWGPWGFNSGCGTEDVDRAEAEAAGAIKPSDKVKPISKEFNDRLQQSVAGLGPDVRSWIKRQLGDMVTIYGDKAIYNKPEPSPPPKPDSVPVARPAKTPEQIRQQRQRIGDKIAARQQREATDRDQISRRLWDDFFKRRTQALAPLTDRVDAAAVAYANNPTPATRDAYMDALKARNKAETSWKIGGMLYKATQKAIASQQQASWGKTYRDSLRFLSLDNVTIPKDQRGAIATSMVKIDSRLRVIPGKPKKLSSNVQQGLELVRSLVPPSKLPPSIGFHISDNPNDRAFQFKGFIKITTSDEPSIVAHELAHAIEAAHPDILRKSAAFLYDRAQGEKPLSLRMLFPSHNYRATELTLKDQWADHGGDHYIGKLYINGYYPSMSKNEFVDRLQGSEILSMGIQRILESPVSFQRQDPDYYQFIKSQLTSL
ncbi:hypothetical protein [uncultured Akkermansia sp.]|uniref:hypothetical protein n=1 Tax=uncultured Akkermansia sp. TaxID=512294 RepID=UPI00260102E0|nr:hypothetical protein [uncultured Akkermansia sp.]